MEGWGFDSYKLTPHFGDKAELCHFLGLSLHLFLYRIGNVIPPISIIQIHYQFIAVSLLIKIKTRFSKSWRLYTMIETSSIDVKYDSGTLNYTLLVAGQVDTRSEAVLAEPNLYIIPK